jgi:8-amino-7-oxononanoate synthase
MRILKLYRYMTVCYQLILGGKIQQDMRSGQTFEDYIHRRFQLSGEAILGMGNPWFVALDELRAKTEATGGKLTSFANYDYLSLAGHPAVTRAAADALSRFGTGVLGSRLVGGERTIHGEFERDLAKFMGTEAALTLVSGSLTNTSIIPHLIGTRDLLIVDEFCHNSIFAGAHAVRSRILQFRHNDFVHLESLLQENRQQVRNCLIVVEGLYSMDGDIPDLPRLLQLKEAYSTWLLVDEAHSFGVLGATGRGISEHFGEDPTRIDLIIGSLSKALVSCGGFICARKEVIEFMKFTLGGFVYSVGISPVAAGAAHSALGILISEPQRVKAVRTAAKRFLTKSREAGLNTGTAAGYGIVPVVFQSFQETMDASEALLRSNIFAPPIVHVGVPKDLPRIRFFLSTNHCDDPAIEEAVEILSQKNKKMPAHRSFMSSTAVS